MALIAMAVYDLDGSGRTELTKQTLECITDTVDLSKHRLFIINNRSCMATRDVLSHYEHTAGISIIHNTTNVGTANAINQAWRQRKDGEFLIKIDNDVVIHYDGWVDELQSAMEVGRRLDEPIGILGLKRKDLIESPYTNGYYQSKLIQLPHVPGERWYNIEVCNHVMGTCQMYLPELIDAIGGLYQMDGVYGFDDSLAAIRCQLAGFQNAFLNYIDIDHIDKGGNDYQNWKEGYVQSMFEQYEKVKYQMVTGQRPIHFAL